MSPEPCKCASRYALDQAVVARAIALGRRDHDGERGTVRLALERLLQTRNQIAVALDVGERLATRRTVEHGAAVVLQRVMNRDHPVCGNFHVCLFLLIKAYTIDRKCRLQVVSAGGGDPHLGAVSDLQLRPPAMRTTPSISGASALVRAIGIAVDPVDQHPHAARPWRQPLRADFGRELHESRAALALHLRRHRRLAQRIGGGALDRRILEAADPIERRRAQPVEQLGEIGLGFARKADDEGAADREVRHLRAPGGDALRAYSRRRPGAS